MFGIYRYILSLMVVFSHLWPFSFGNFSGAYAVFSFYMLSGFLMTLVLNTTYDFTANGIARYLLNRILRIYPPYWVTIGISITVITLLPDPHSRIHPSLNLPSGLSEWFTNITLFNMRNFDRTRMIPPAWSLFIEFFFYIAMGILLSRKKIITFLWFGLSLLFTAYLIITGADFNYRYYAIPATSIAFSAGAMIYHIKDFIVIDRRLLPVSIGLFLANWIYWHIARNGIGTGFYLHIVFSALLLLCLCKIDRKKNSFIKIDAFLGNLSYPIFLCHWPVAVLLAGFFTTLKRGNALFLISFIPVNLVAFLIHYIVEFKIENIRSLVRDASATEIYISKRRMLKWLRSKEDGSGQGGRAR